MSEKYNYAKTIWKSAASFLSVLLVVAPPHLAAIDWEAGGFDDINWWLTIGAPTAVAIIRAALDYRKHGGKWAGPVFEIPTDKFAPLVAAGLAVAMAGCAHNSAQFSEVALDGTRTEFRQRNIVTWGSSLDEGSGNMHYAWDGQGGGAIAVGNAAHGAVSGDPTEALLGVVNSLLAGYMAMLQAPRPEPSPGALELLLDPATLDALMRLRDGGGR